MKKEQINDQLFLIDLLLFFYMAEGKEFSVQVDGFLPGILDWGVVLTDGRMREEMANRS